MRRYGLALILILFVTGLHAARKVTVKTRIKEAYTALKSSSGQEKIEKILFDSISRPGVDNALRAEGYYVCALLEQSINEDLNQKAYLKQKLDTLRLFKSVYMMYDYVLMCDSVDFARRYTDKGRKILARHRANLLGGGKFLLKAEKWADAYRYFDMYLSTMTDEEDSVRVRLSYWATLCAMNDNKPYDVLKYVRTSMDNGRSEDCAVLMEYMCRAYAAVGDSLHWIDSIKEGVGKYPRHDYFFLNLMDWYIRHDELDSASTVTDSLIAVDSKIPNYWFAKSLIALKRQRYTECINMCEECLKLAPDYAEAWYNKGISLLNMTLNEKNNRRVMELYRRAEKPMEMVRKLQPHAVDRWGKPLYRIYLKLNRGEKFEEIDRLLTAN